MHPKGQLIAYSTFAAFSLVFGVYGVSKYYLTEQKFAKWDANTITCYDYQTDNYFEVVADQETQTVALNWSAHWNPHAQIELKTGYFKSDGSVTWLDSCYTFLKHENLTECVSAITFDPRTAFLTAIDLHSKNVDAVHDAQVGTVKVEATTYRCYNPNDDTLLRHIQ